MTISSQKVLELKQSVCQDIDARANDLVSISHQLHAKPETISKNTLLTRF
jgi:hypothetical protein